MISRKRIAYRIVLFLVLLFLMHEVDAMHINPFGPGFFQENLIPALFLLMYVAYTFLFDHD